MNNTLPKIEPHKLNIVNRDEFPCFKPSPRDPYKIKKRVKSVKFVQTSHDDKFKELKKKHQDFLVTSHEILVKKPIDGIFSPLFGADTTQDSPIYTCDCHELTGGSNQGRVCPKCGTKVRTIEADLRFKMYIDIAPYHILSYHGYNAFCRVYKHFSDVITTPRKITKSGEIAKSDLPTLQEIYNDYDELYKDKIGLDKKIAFMSKIPVYSARLRPLIQQGMNMTILDVNKKYLSIVTLSEVLTSAQFLQEFSRDLEIIKTLNQVQLDYIEICKIVNSQIDGKTGVFRRAMASGRLDNSARLVITLGTDLQPCECDVPYSFMMTQYEEEIANYLSRIKDIPISKAISLVEEHSTYPDPIYVKLINQLLKSKLGIWILTNRNPTISKHGIQYTRIRKIHDDPDDYTLHFPPDVLKAFGADFKNRRSGIGSNPSKEHAVNA